MSIVAVHGPYTFGSKAVVEAGAVMAVVDPANGLKWDFKLDTLTTRPDQDFSWAFPTDGTPTPQTVADPTVVTYATPGSKTATLTVTNVSRTVTNKALTNNVATLTTSATHGFKVGQSVVVSGIDTTFNGTYTILATPTGTTFTYAKTAANVTSGASGGTVTSDSAQYPPAGSYPITVTAVSGVAPLEMQMMGAPGGEEGGGEQPAPEGHVDVAFDPAAHTIDEVMEFVQANPDQAKEMLDAEVAGKNRITLVTQLQELAFDPGDYTVTQVIGYVEDHPDKLEDVIAAEQAGRNRTTLVTQLESMRQA